MKELPMPVYSRAASAAVFSHADEAIDSESDITLVGGDIDDDPTSGTGRDNEETDIDTEQTDEFTEDTERHGRNDSDDDDDDEDDDDDDDVSVGNNIPESSTSTKSDSKSNALGKKSKSYISPAVMMRRTTTEPTSLLQSARSAAALSPESYGMLPRNERGHVFIVHGDLLKLCCDAWLLPTNRNLKVEDFWKVHPDRIPSADELPGNWSDRGARVVRAKERPRHHPGEAGLVAYLTNVGGDVAGISQVEWFLDGARQFLDAVHADFKRLKHTADKLQEVADRAKRKLDMMPVEFPEYESTKTTSDNAQAEAARAKRASSAAFRRCRPLVALPLIGTGHGGAAAFIGDIINGLLEMLMSYASTVPFDICLVIFNREMYSAAQKVRKLMKRQPWHCFGHQMSKALRRQTLLHADFLASKARHDELVLFIGAGCSYNAGLPLWNDLLSKLARVAGMNTTEQSALSSLDYLDRARLIEQRLDERKRRFRARMKSAKQRRDEAQIKQLQAKLQDLDMGQIVARELITDREQYALQHGLLASLRSKQNITTNYDRMFEIARQSAENPVAVIPHKPNSGHTDAGWLLKMHGCVTEPAKIVLSRDQYLSYQSDRSALAGLVAAMLVTKHMLFIGFSLTDPNFHKICGAVRLGYNRRKNPDASFTGANSANQKTRGKTDSKLAAVLSDSKKRYKNRNMPPGGIAKQKKTPAQRRLEKHGRTVAGRLGSALMLVEDALFEELWRRDICIRPMTERDEKTYPQSWMQMGEGARQLEIFLDYVSMHATDDSNYVLDPRFGYILSDAERQFAQFFVNFVQGAPAYAKCTIGWSEVVSLWMSLGGQVERSNAEPTPAIERSNSTEMLTPSRSVSSIPSPSPSPSPTPAPTPSNSSIPIPSRASSDSKLSLHPTADSQPGHVFVIRTDIRVGDFDAWLMPSTHNFVAMGHWLYPSEFCRDWYRARGTAVPVCSPPDDCDLGVLEGISTADRSKSRIGVIPTWPTDRSPPYLASLGGSLLDHRLLCVEQFFYHASRDVKTRPPRNNRSHHLLAIPVVATGYGGLRIQTAAVVHVLMQMCFAAAKRYKIDIVFVCWDDVTFGLAQMTRFRLYEHQLTSVMSAFGLELTDEELTSKRLKRSIQRLGGALSFQELYTAIVMARQSSSASNEDSTPTSGEAPLSGGIDGDNGSDHGMDHDATEQPEGGILHLEDSTIDDNIESAADLVSSSVTASDATAPTCAATAAATATAKIAYAHAPKISAHALRSLSQLEQFPSLSPRLIEHARFLAERAVRNELVLFFDTPQVGGTTPTLTDALYEIGQELKLSAADLKDLQDLTPAEQGKFLKQCFGERSSDFYESLALKLRVLETPLLHALLAKLPIAESITSSYDNFYETARDRIDSPVDVLEQSFNGRSWLMKLNGCVTRPRHMTVTESDRSDSSRRAVLQAILEALLISKHVVCVGTNTNNVFFQSALDSVRKVVHDSKDHYGDSICSFVTPHMSRVKRATLEPDVQVISLDDGDGHLAEDPREGYRQLCVFWDCVQAHIAIMNQGTQHLLDPRMSDSLTSAEVELRDYIDTSLALFPHEACDSAAFDRFVDMLVHLGVSHSENWMYQVFYTDRAAAASAVRHELVNGSYVLRGKLIDRHVAFWEKRAFNRTKTRKAVEKAKKNYKDSQRKRKAKRRDLTGGGRGGSSTSSSKGGRGGSTMKS
jgi:SIR2-like domain